MKAAEDCRLQDAIAHSKPAGSSALLKLPGLVEHLLVVGRGNDPFSRVKIKRASVYLAGDAGHITPGKESAKPADHGNQNQVAANGIKQKTPRPRGFSRQEREQLAADLRLIPRDDDELPFVLSDEPKQ